MKTIFLEPLWKLRREYQDLIQNPPEGYRFLVRETVTEEAARRLANTNLAYEVLNGLLRIAPIQLVKPYWERFKRLPRGLDLTYAILHVVFRKEPWVLDMRLEQPHLLVGGEAVFARWKNLLRRLLASSHCKKIIYELDAGRQAFLQRMSAPELAEKVQVVHSGVPRRSFKKVYGDGGIKLLFVNSANINAARHFYSHGGGVLLAAFLKLIQRHDNLELTIRSGLPQGLKEGLKGMSNVKIIDQVIPWDELDEELKSADIFVYPTHVTPSIVFLDAMSYELPIVTTDVWGNPELVQDGRTGLLVHHPQAHRYTEGFVVHFDGPEFRRVTTTVDPALVEAIAEKVSVLINNPELRRKLGREGRHEVEEGQFSVEQRNRRLKKVLDEATASG